MIESIAASVINSVIPEEYMPIVLVILTAIVGVEQWLASTKKIQANSTVQLIVGVCKKIIGKHAPELQKAPEPERPTDDIPETRRSDG